MLRCPIVCGEPGCGATNVRGTRWCEKHQVSNTAAAARKQYDAERADDETRKMYATARWLNFRGWLISQNPVCQKISNGVRCTRFSFLVHHIWSPRARPDLFTSAAHCVCLCALCHDARAGTPEWRPGVDFVPTVFSPPNFG